MSKSKSGKKTTKPKRKATKQKPNLLFRLFKWCFVLALWGVIAVSLLLAWYARELPDVTEAMVFERRPTIIIKASNGKILDRYGDIKGESVAIEDLPSHLIYAVLAIEDRRFYTHYGLDPVGIARAFVVNIKGGGFIQGGSTITQQLAKNLFLSRDRTLKRKIQEAMLAFWLEQKLEKDEILSAYLNRVYMGAGAYGVDAAARVYFNKSATEISLRESATLAGLLKAPSRYSPGSNPVLAAQRTKTVLQAMVNAGFIEQSQIDIANALPPAPRRKPSSGETIRYFTDYVVSQINDLVGPSEQDLIIETTLDPDIQNEAEETITKALLKHSESKKIEQGAAVVMRLDGAVMAMVGGRNYGMSEFNRATHSFRPPGSSFKPIVYLTALEKGWSITDIIIDEPIRRGRYRPQNFGHQYYGEVTIIEALTRSLNTVAVNLMRDVGPGEAISMARRLGITADLEPDLSLSLGSSGIPVLEMTTAYATLGRGGLAVEPFAIKRITDKSGTVYYEHKNEEPTRRVVSQHAVNGLAQMMRSVVDNGTGKSARPGFPVAGKTGTSQDYRDAWFIGFSNRYAAAVWFGNDDNSPTERVTGGSVPSQVWREIIAKAHTKPSPVTFNTVNATADFSFHDLLGRLFSGEYDQEEEKQLNNRRPAAGPEYTPRGRHQWEFNE